MTSMTSKRVAVVISLIATFIAVTLIFIFAKIDSQQLLLQLTFAALLMFIVVYIVSYYIINTFISEKIKPIYKTIRKLDIPKDELQSKIEDTDIIKDINEEVITWAKDKTKEIADLKASAKYRKEYLGNVSHELKTPIFNIQGYVLTLLDGALDDPKINKVYLERTEKSINRMISIVNDLEEISKVESGELNLNYTNFDIIELTKEIFEAQEIRANHRGTTMEIQGSGDRSLLVYADRQWINQVVTNLIVNAISYSKDNGKMIVSFMDMDEHILVEISDDGIGISEKNLPRIFERFYRVDKSRSRDQGGTGLGLAIVKHIIEAHNQTINVRSTENQGTSFAFTLKKGERALN